MRAFFLSERLAILELIIPAVAVVAMVAAGSPRTWVSRATRWAPLIFAPAVIAVFGVFEYSRSWVFYQARTGGSFLDFAVERLSGYYTTAYNNGQMLYMFDNVAGRIPLRTLEVVWTAPVVEQLGEPRSKQELGGWEIQLAAGAVDAAVDSENEAFAHARRFLSYLPSSVWDLPPRAQPRLDRERRKLVYERMNLRRAKSQLGRVFSPETRDKIRAAKSGVPMSPEARLAMSIRQRERFKDPKEREKMRAIAFAREIAKKNKRLQDPLETAIFGRRA